MTIEKFCEINSIRNKQKVKKWIQDGLIPGANLSKNYIPDSARIPYTNTRARTATSICKSIVHASEKRYHVLPQLFKISNDEFQGYIDCLVHEKLIAKRITDNITYYDAIVNGDTIRTPEHQKFVKSVIEGVVCGAVSAVIKQSQQ